VASNIRLDAELINGIAAQLQLAADHMHPSYDRFGIGDKVQTTVSPADGLRGKPHPDIFLEAAKRLGVDPAECLVFEDAPLGVEAARRAGMKAVALTTTMGADAFAGFDNVVAVVPDLLDIRLTFPIHQP
jgi:beta-phosphoglucomutase-like phosphatase (HAD superfamily)